MGFKIQNGGTPDEFPGNILFDLTISSGVLVDTASPVWSFQSVNSARVSPGNLFEIATSSGLRGDDCLQYNYTGRNNACNTCGISGGGVSRTQKSGYDGVTYFVDSAGANLVTNNNAAVGRTVINQSNGFSRWTISSIANELATNDRLNLTLVSGPIDGSTANFHGGDTVPIYLECGVDGSVGNDINRRNDCDAAISYWGNISSQAAGTSLFRRVYVKYVGSISDLPDNDQKFCYWNSSNGGMFLGFNTVSGNKNWVVFGLNAVGGPGAVNIPVNMAADTWYYIEQEFRSESSGGAADGFYRCWVYADGDTPGDPQVEETGLSFSAVTTASMWGNEQHNNDTAGYWLIDKLTVADTRIGAAP